MKKQKLKRIRKKAGLPPGSIIFTGNQKVEKIFIHYVQYSEEQLIEKSFDNHKEVTLNPSPEDKVDWYDIRGLHDTDLIEIVGKTFGIHSLVLEDIVSTHQRPKFEEYPNGNFLIIRALAYDKEKLEIMTEQVAIFFRKGLLISFQEAETDLFEAVRTRIQSGRGRIRQRSSDYLAYALLDNIVDNYYVVLDDIESVIETLEDNLLSNPDDSIKEQIHHLKKELLVVRKSIAPLREAIGQFSKSDSALIEESSTIYIRDLYDHTVQIMDMVETYRDMLNSLQDLYISEISLRMNQVMQILAIITTIFVPLSFMAGMYGMNFDHMPELHFKYGYFILVSIMFIIAVSLVIYFRRKKWM
ncbi:MAG: magnesium transporter [Saprospiraceae bacterium]|jgi:magnesium transporter